MSWRAQNRSKDAKTPSEALAMSKTPEPDCCPIQPYLRGDQTAHPPPWVSPNSTAFSQSASPRHLPKPRLWQQRLPPPPTRPRARPPSQPPGAAQQAEAAPQASQPAPHAPPSISFAAPLPVALGGCRPAVAAADQPWLPLPTGHGRCRPAVTAADRPWLLLADWSWPTSRGCCRLVVAVQPNYCCCRLKRQNAVLLAAVPGYWGS
jgi:hypothetical protein